MRSRYANHDGKIFNSQCEINIVEHCNLSCRSCSHLSPVLPRHQVDPSALEQSLITLGKHYHARFVKLLGGEPLLHRSLLEVIGAVRRSGVADEITIVTNGTLLSTMPFTFWEGVDNVLVSLYPGHKQTDEELEDWRQAANAADVELTLQRLDYFQESYSEIGTKDGALVKRIYRSCDLAHTWRCHTVADGHFWKCPQSYFSTKLFPAPEGEPRYADGVKIEDDPALGGRLRAHLESSEPLVACRHCLGTAGRDFAHTRTPRRDFRALQQRPTEDLLDYGKLASRPMRRIKARLQRIG